MNTKQENRKIEMKLRLTGTGAKKILEAFGMRYSLYERPELQEFSITCSLFRKKQLVMEGSVSDKDLRKAKNRALIKTVSLFINNIITEEK